MALAGTRILCNNPTTIPHTQFTLRRPSLVPSSSNTLRSQSRRAHLIVTAAKKFTSGKNRRSSTSTKEQVKEDELQDQNVQIGFVPEDSGSAAAVSDDGRPMPELPGLEANFWEGPQWDGLGFFVQYMWAFSVVFALVACGVAVATYNEGATDFKATPVYKESIQSRELLEEPEASNSEVFESNPTEDAPSLE